MIRESDANINKILTELSDEISFEYDVSSDTMLFSERYKMVYGRKNKIPHFYRECRKKDSISENTLTQLDELRRMIDYGDVNRYLQIQWPDKNDKYEWCEIVFRHVIDTAGNIKAVGIWRNIDRQKREQIMLKYQIATEDIDGVQNRSGIEQQVGKELQLLELGETAAVFSPDTDMVEPKVSVENDWYSCPNVFRAVSDNVSAIARDESTDSRLSTVTRGREIWQEETNCDLSDNETLSAYAIRRLKELQNPARTVSYDRRYNPDVTIGSYVQLNYPEISGKVKITSQSITLGYACTTAEEGEIVE